MRAIDVHGFSGAFALGAVQAGFELVGKFSRGVGFGVYNTLANRHLLGENWESVAGRPEDWEVIDADYIFGNPPCSGFSTLSNKAFRGVDSSINDYMWELVKYAAKVAPPIVAYESVQQTFTQGLSLLRELRQYLNEHSGQKYHLYHVLHNNASLGGISMRKRYFWVCARVPFGVEWCRVLPNGEATDVTSLPVLRDMLRDLSPLGTTLELQPYRSTSCPCTEPFFDDEEALTDDLSIRQCECEYIEVNNSSKWCKEEIHDGTGMVDGHDYVRSPTWTRAQDVILTGIEWNEGELLSDVLRRYYHKHKDLPNSWKYNTTKTDGNKITVLTKQERLVETDFAMGHNQLCRWRSDRMARVVTGGGVHLILHPWHNRTLTQREVARIQGFPDAWKIWPVRSAPDLGPGWGKGVPVQAGRWISYWAAQSIAGSPGSLTTTNDKRWAKLELQEDESVIDLTYAYKNAPGYNPDAPL